MTPSLVVPAQSFAQRRQSSRAPVALLASVLVHVSAIGWAAQLVFHSSRHAAVERGVNAALAIESAFSTGDQETTPRRNDTPDIALQIPKSDERESPEDRLVTGGLPKVSVSKQTHESPEPSLQVGDMPSPQVPTDAPSTRRETSPSPQVTLEDQVASVPRARKAAEVRVEPIEPSVASAASSASQSSRGAESPVAPSALVNPAPDYPAEALSRRLTGRVVLRVRVDEVGKVVLVEVYRTSGHTLLDTAAAHAVERWRYEPPRGAQLHEFAVPVSFVIPGR